MLVSQAHAYHEAPQTLADLYEGCDVAFVHTVVGIGDFGDVG